MAGSVVTILSLSQELHCHILQHLFDDIVVEYNLKAYRVLLFANRCLSVAARYVFAKHLQVLQARMLREDVLCQLYRNIFTNPYVCISSSMVENCVKWLKNLVIDVYDEELEDYVVKNDHIDRFDVVMKICVMYAERRKFVLSMSKEGIIHYSKGKIVVAKQEMKGENFSILKEVSFSQDDWFDDYGIGMPIFYDRALSVAGKMVLENETSWEWVDMINGMNCMIDK